MSKVILSKLMKKILKNKEARKQLSKALDNEGTINFDNKVYRVKYIR